MSRNSVSGTAEQLVERRLSGVIMERQESMATLLGHGHEFVKTTFYQPTFCHHCTDMLWGLRNQGIVCEICHFTCHDKCVQELSVKCPFVQQVELKVPVPHSWSKPISLQKRSFCNVCRQKISHKCVICSVCKYHAHIACKAGALNNCKRCATGDRKFEKRHGHHWVEGNLPNDAKCCVCHKSCSTSECLASQKCGWCGRMIHSGCLSSLPLHETCDYQDLSFQIIPPHCVIASHTEEEEAGEEEEETDEINGTPEDHSTEEDEKRPICVYDGVSSTARRRQKQTLKPMNVSKDTAAGDIISLFLKKSHIADSPANYYLTHQTEDGKEVVLVITDYPYNYTSSGGRPANFYVKSKTDTIMSNIRVQVDDIVPSYTKAVKLPLEPSSTVEDIIGKALGYIELEDEHPSDFVLVETSPATSYIPVELDRSEIPWVRLQELRQVSLRNFVNIRYALKRKVKENWTPVFIYGLPKERLRTQELYTSFFMEIVEEIFPGKEKFPVDQVKIGPAYPNGSCLFVECPEPKLAHLLCNAVPSSILQPKAQVLPTIKEASVDHLLEPLLVFCNGRSGGNQGVQLLLAFKRHLNPYQVFDLANGGPYPGLYVFRKLKNLRILIGGGDGTFGWVLSALQDCQGNLACPNPPCALLPLGTGNDLARALKWGSGYTGEKPVSILRSLENTDKVDFDRWAITFQEDHAAPHKDLLGKLASASAQVATLDINTNRSGGGCSQAPAKVIPMNNYFGIGLDAQIAHDFHVAREENPEKFNSRFKNKSAYVQLTLKSMVAKEMELHKHLRVTVDGEELKLPALEGLVLLNIQSWAAGADPWGTTGSEFSPASYNDGKLEVVGLAGVMHMAQVHGGMRSGLRLAQGSDITVRLTEPVAVQVDGEAWIQQPGSIRIQLIPNKAAMLIKNKKGEKPRSIPPKVATKASTSPSLLSSPSVSSSRYAKRQHNPFFTLKESFEDERDRKDQ